MSLAGTRPALSEPSGTDDSGDDEAEAGRNAW